MKKKRISSDVPAAMLPDLDAKAKALGISRPAYIEIAIQERMTDHDIQQVVEQLKRDVMGVKAERDAVKLQREDEVKRLTEQRDEFERKMHDEVDVSNKFYANWQASKKALSACETKIQKLLNRGIFARLFNRIPWAKGNKGREKRMWDTPARPISPTQE